MKSMKKVMALVVAFILTFSVLTFAGSAANESETKETVPSYSEEDLTLPTRETEPTKPIEEIIDEGIKDLLGDADLDGIRDAVNEGVSAGFSFTTFFKNAMRAIVELFEHIANLLFPAK